MMVNEPRKEEELCQENDTELVACTGYENWIKHLINKNILTSPLRYTCLENFAMDGVGAW